MPVVGALSIPISLDMSALNQSIGAALGEIGMFANIMDQGILGTLLNIEREGVAALDRLSQAAESLGRPVEDFVSPQAVDQLERSVQSAGKLKMAMDELKVELGASVDTTFFKGIAANMASFAAVSVRGIREGVQGVVDPTGGGITDETRARIERLRQEKRSLMSFGGEVPRGERATPFAFGSVEEELARNAQRRELSQRRQLEQNRRAVQVRIDR